MAADLTVGDSDLIWGFASAESNFRISGLSVSRKTLNQETVQDETGKKCAFGASGSDVSATIKGKPRGTGPATWTLNTLATVANTTLFSMGGPSITSVVCVGADTDQAPGRNADASYSFVLLDF